MQHSVYERTLLDTYFIVFNVTIDMIENIWNKNTTLSWWGNVLTVFHYQ